MPARYLEALLPNYSPKIALKYFIASRCYSRHSNCNIVLFTVIRDDFFAMEPDTYESRSELQRLRVDDSRGDRYFTENNYESVFEFDQGCVYESMTRE